jgi:hypothetical protein
MVPGFNTDFKYRGETYHVQTEDNGVGNPVVVTLLYHKGAILASRRSSYRDLAGKPGFERELLVLMKTQHKDLMRALLAGAFDRDGAAPAAGGGGDRPALPAPAAAAAAPRPASMSLDQAIRRYLEKFAATAAAAGPIASTPGARARRTD